MPKMMKYQMTRHKPGTVKDLISKFNNKYLNNETTKKKLQTKRTNQPKNA